MRLRAALLVRASAGPHLSVVLYSFFAPVVSQASTRQRIPPLHGALALWPSKQDEGGDDVDGVRVRNSAAGGESPRRRMAAGVGDGDRFWSGG